MKPQVFTHTLWEQNFKTEKGILRAGLGPIKHALGHVAGDPRGTSDPEPWLRPHDFLSPVQEQRVSRLDRGAEAPRGQDLPETHKLRSELEIGVTPRLCPRPRKFQCRPAKV